MMLLLGVLGVFLFFVVPYAVVGAVVGWLMGGPVGALIGGAVGLLAHG